MSLMTSKWTYISPGQLRRHMQLYLFPPDFITWCNEESSITFLKVLPPTKYKSKNVPCLAGGTILII